MISLKKNFVVIGVLVAALILVIAQVLMKKDTHAEAEKRSPLHVRVDQSVRAFVEANSELPAFKSPLHPISDGQFIFHNVSELIAVIQDKSPPLVFASQAPYGSAVVTLDTYDLNRRGADTDRVKSVAFRPGSSSNGAVVALEFYRKFYEVIGNYRDCGPAKNFESASHRESLSLEVLTSALASPDSNYLYRDVYQCGDSAITFQISRPFWQRQAPTDERGFDVLLLVGSVSPAEHRAE